ncbi:MAG TPA: ATP-binding protein [Labilithrix sp.]|jgi:nitrogen fixation/metabolism regulation signal transduction histidine kinase|nr:ATP-binding protein [Labilithrix sp.]
MKFSATVSLTVCIAVAAAFALGLTAANRSMLEWAMAGTLALVMGVLVSLRIRNTLTRPLRTAVNVLDAVRHHDYAHRARTDVVSGPLKELLDEANALARHLADERERANEASALFEGVVRRIDIALLAFDDAGVLAWWNPAAERVFDDRLADGTTAEALGIESWLEGPSERPVTLPGGSTLSTWELRRGTFLRAGRVYQFVLLASLRRVRREEERAAWQRLLRVIGHEVNNTLAPVSSLAATSIAMLRDDGPLASPSVLRALEVIEHRSASLGRFIAEYARLARLPEPKGAPTQIAALIRRLAAMDTRCPVHVVGTGDITVFADGPLLEQALLNLIRNAIDAAVVTDGEVTIDWSVEGAEAVIVIVDDGPGIENPENLFVPLFSTKPGGSGIGLVLARNILEAHGGELRLENRARAEGCIARVAIPLADRESPPDSVVSVRQPRY